MIVARLTQCITQVHVLYGATISISGIEIASYIDIHGFGQIFRQAGPVAPLCLV